MCGWGLHCLLKVIHSKLERTSQKYLLNVAFFQVNEAITSLTFSVFFFSFFFCFLPVCKLHHFQYKSHFLMFSLLITHLAVYINCLSWGISRAGIKASKPCLSTTNYSCNCKGRNQLQTIFAINCMEGWKTYYNTQTIYYPLKNFQSLQISINFHLLKSGACLKWTLKRGSQWPRSQLQFCTNSLTTKKQTTKFSSANFQKMLSPSYTILRTETLRGQQCRSRWGGLSWATSSSKFSYLRLPRWELIQLIIAILQSVDLEMQW